MSAWVPQRGGTLLITSGTNQDPDKKHLFIICTNPDKNGQVLLVSICSRQDKYDDKTCTLGPSVHAFLNRKSYVSYRHARIESASDLQKRVANGTIEPLTNLKDTILEEICVGFAKSDKTPRKCQIFYDKNTSS